MRGEDQKQEAMFSYVLPEKRVPADHPLRGVRQMAQVPYVLFYPLALLLFIAELVQPTLSQPKTESRLNELREIKSLKYRSIGPALGGRICRVAGVPGTNTFYAVTAAGGVWRSTNDGTSWAPIFDGQPDSSIGSIAIAPSNPNVIYVGAGEANIRAMVVPGHGIYKSVDGGKTWSHVCWTGCGAFRLTSCLRTNRSG
jgi:hypothetical protein